MEAVVDYVQSQGYQEISLLGASFGGGVAILYTVKNQTKIKSLCLWNPVLNYDHCFLNPTLPWLIERKGHMKKDLKEKGWTTIGSRKVVYGKKLFDEMAKFFPYNELVKIKIPVIIFHGDKDTYVPVEDSREYIKGVGEFYLIRDASHGFQDNKQEVINKTLAFFK